MTGEEVFYALTGHMLEGLMIHEQFIDYYDFLALPNYRKCHKKHYYAEDEAYRHINHYYIKTYNKLLPVHKFDQPEVIPSSWRQYTRQDVDMKTKQTAVKQGLEQWLSWEKDTLVFYQQLYQDLIMNNNVADAEEIKKLILDVQGEIHDITQYQLNKIATNYDMVYITEEQDKII